MTGKDVYESSNYDFNHGERYYLETPFGQVKFFTENGKVILQFFTRKMER